MSLAAARTAALAVIVLAGIASLSAASSAGEARGCPPKKAVDCEPKGGKKEKPVVEPAPPPPDDPPPPEDPPPPPTPPGGEITFDDGFDARSFSHWSHVQASCRYGTSSSLIDGFVPGLRSGGYAARFHLRHGVTSPVASNNEACEVTKIRESYRLGQTEYYGMRFRIVGPYAVPYQWGLVHQLAYPTVRYHNLGTNLRDAVTLNVQNGRWGGSAYEHSVFNRGLSSIATGNWNEYIWKVTWATGWTAGLEIWHRLNGSGSWTKVYERFGVPTQQWGSTEYACVTAEGRNCSDGTHRVALDKLGAYRAYNPAGQQDLVVDHDVFVLGTTFDVVAHWLDSH